MLLLASDEMPLYNLSQSCRSETATAVGDRNCLANEQQARETLLRQWSRFAPADKGNCLQVEEDWRRTELRGAAHVSANGGIGQEVAG